MSTDQTAQVKGGGSKVPKCGWPSVLYVTEIGPGSLPPSFRASPEDTWLPELPKQSYVSVSTLLSDEVVGAGAIVFRRAILGNEFQSDDDIARGILQAAVDHLGGTDAH